MRHLFSKFPALLLATLLLVTACDASGEVREKSKQSKSLVYTPSRSFPGSIYRIRRSVLRIIAINDLKVENLHKLDFSKPNTKTYGDNPKYEIFNPESGGLKPSYFKDVLEDFQQYLEADSEIIISLGNRIKNAQSADTELIAIVTGMKKQFCLDIHQDNDDFPEEIPSIGKAPNLTPFPEEVDKQDVVTLPHEIGCVKTPSGYYYYQYLVKR